MILIDADDIENITVVCNDRGCLKRIKAPAVDAEPVKHGEWVYGEFDIPHCSECGKEIMPCNISRYCPDCGAKMDATNEAKGLIKDENKLDTSV